MEIETKVISIETIKPSSPTPKSLQKHHLSIIDQSMPPIYMPSVNVYASNPKISNTEKSKQLKKCLLEVLSRAATSATYTSTAMMPALPSSKPKQTAIFRKLFPMQTLKFSTNKMDELQAFCMAVQATYFRCGGLALAILISHKIADGTSFNLFVNTWSAVARNGDAGGMPLLKLDAAAYFPPLQDTSVLKPTMGMTKEEMTTRIFTFPAPTVSLLRERYSGGGVRPSRVEALSAFIWTQFVSATGTRSDPNKIHSLVLSVDGRRRANPPLSKFPLGNIIGTSSLMLASGDGGVEVVRKIREAVRAVNTGDVARRNNIGSVKHMIKMMVFLNFSSLCGLPLYEADFGWGMPVWVGLAQYPFKNMTLFMDTKSGGGIEAFIHLTKQDIVKFEAHLDMPMLKNNL